MVRRSWFYRNGLFYTILATVILIHLILLILRMQRNDSVVDYRAQKDRVFKVQIVDKSPETKLRKQIVQSEDSNKAEKPKDDAFLSDKDRSTDRQTVARRVDRFNQGGGQKGRQSKKELSLSDLSAFKKGYHPLKDATKAKTVAKQSASTDAGPQNNRSGVSSTNDYIENVPLGDLTYLNTVEYKYYGFFHRIRQKLEQFWGRSIQELAENLAKKKRSIASGNLITSLEVTLNEAGEVVGIKLRGTSGIQELDDAAINSFNEAGPFPNPPKGLIKDGVVKIEWGFVVNPS